MEHYVNIAGTYANPAGYEAYMGGWSRTLAPMLLDFAFAGFGDPPDRVLDVGCGTGILIGAIHERFPAAALAGIDPSPSQLAHARRRDNVGASSFEQGTADHLPFDDDSFDACLSLLVLQELKGLGPLVEMRRVTRPGGIVAACQWDFDRMPVIAGLSAAIVEVVPATTAQMATRGPHLYGSEGDLVTAWTAAGMTDVAAGRLTAVRTYAGFDDLWGSLQAGSTPSTMKLAALHGPERESVRASLLRRFRENAPGVLTVAAEALVVTGRA